MNVFSGTKMDHVCELKLKWKQKKITKQMRAKGIGKIVCSAAEAAECLSWLKESHREIFVLLLLDSGNTLLSAVELFAGGNGCANIDIPEILRRVLTANAVSFIIAHNHPSMNSSPSRNDTQITEEIAEAAKAVKLVFQDHIIIGESFYSFRNQNPELFNT
ncbi:hypothetical protein GF336_05610 [Candidatus Woesearchaeota archaeon]|nr:hypothetical protein [Candidatus Woesearchaeota archaeon]